ncbi:hypothetical protein K438DRAFT_1756739 [Mycena galopus ATCC 62051]|nr:hypothetical protein K438DRAFT_1756739 [Mycena galopus ATCC 62051]
MRGAENSKPKLELDKILGGPQRVGRSRRGCSARLSAGPGGGREHEAEGRRTGKRSIGKVGITTRKRRLVLSTRWGAAAARGSECEPCVLEYSKMAAAAGAGDLGELETAAALNNRLEDCSGERQRTSPRERLGSTEKSERASRLLLRAGAFHRAAESMKTTGNGMDKDTGQSSPLPQMRRRFNRDSRRVGHWTAVEAECGSSKTTENEVRRTATVSARQAGHEPRTGLRCVKERFSDEGLFVLMFGLFGRRGISRHFAASSERGLENLIGSLSDSCVPYYIKTSCF